MKKSVLVTSVIAVIAAFAYAMCTTLSYWSLVWVFLAGLHFGTSSWRFMCDGTASQPSWNLRPGDRIKVTHVVKNLYEYTEILFRCDDECTADIDDTFIKVRTHEIPEGGLRQGCSYVWTGKGFTYLV